MSGLYVMDACALIAFLRKETGGEYIKSLLKSAGDGIIQIRMNNINLLEIYYDIYRSIGKEKATKELAVYKRLPIKFQSDLSGKIFEEAGRLKASYKISIADSIALAEASISGGILLTSDHHEFDVVEKQEKIKFQWIR